MRFKLDKTCLLGGVIRSDKPICPRKNQAYISGAYIWLDFDVYQQVYTYVQGCGFCLVFKKYLLILSTWDLILAPM